MDEYEEKVEAIERTYRYYDRLGIEPPDYNDEEWKAIYNIQLERVREGY